MNINIMETVIVVVAFLIAITVHECAHAWAAYMLGDETARKAGRLTLNPFAHIDPLGLFALIFIRFGWARPVPMDPRNFKYPRLYAVLTGLAGPASNFIMAFFFLYGLKRVMPMYQVGQQAQYFIEFFNISSYINVMLGTFNLLPIPPLDGSHIIQAFIPYRWQYMYYRFSRYSIFILLFLLFIPQFQAFLWGLIMTVYGALSNFVGVHVPMIV